MSRLSLECRQTTRFSYDRGSGPAPLPGRVCAQTPLAPVLCEQGRVCRLLPGLILPLLHSCLCLPPRPARCRAQRPEQTSPRLLLVLEASVRPVTVPSDPPTGRRILSKETRPSSGIWIVSGSRAKGGGGAGQPGEGDPGSPRGSLTVEAGGQKEQV